MSDNPAKKGTLNGPQLSRRSFLQALASSSLTNQFRFSVGTTPPHYKAFVGNTFYALINIEKQQNEFLQAINHLLDAQGPNWSFNRDTCIRSFIWRLNDLAYDAQQLTLARGLPDIYERFFKTGAYQEIVADIFGDKDPVLIPDHILELIRQRSSAEHLLNGIIEKGAETLEQISKQDDWQYYLQETDISTARDALRIFQCHSEKSIYRLGDFSPLDQIRFLVQKGFMMNTSFQPHLFKLPEEMQAVLNEMETHPLTRASAQFCLEEYFDVPLQDFVLQTFNMSIRSVKPFTPEENEQIKFLRKVGAALDEGSSYYNYSWEQLRKLRTVEDLIRSFDDSLSQDALRRIENTDKVEKIEVTEESYTALWDDIVIELKYPKRGKWKPSIGDTYMEFDYSEAGMLIHYLECE